MLLFPTSKEISALHLVFHVPILTLWSYPVKLSIICKETYIMSFFHVSMNIVPYYIHTSTTWFFIQHFLFDTYHIEHWNTIHSFTLWHHIMYRSCNLYTQSCINEPRFNFQSFTIASNATMHSIIQVSLFNWFYKLIIG